MRTIPIALAALSLAAALLPATSAAPTDPDTVSAAGVSFVPAVLVVKVGQPVRWEGSLVGHTVTTANSVVNALQGQGNDERNADLDPDTFNLALAPGGVVTHAFAEPGTYSYHCELHSRTGMVGTIVVEA